MLYQNILIKPLLCFIKFNPVTEDSFFPVIKGLQIQIVWIYCVAAISGQPQFLESRGTLQTDRKDNAMYFDSYEQMNSTGENTIAFIRAVGAISLMAMQKTAELQFTFVSTQMESALEQLKLLSNFRVR